MDKLSIGATGAEVRRASDWLDATCREQEVPQPLADRLVLCLNEVLANVIDHGGAGVSPIGVSLEVTRAPGGGKAGVTVSDAGAAFDPRTVPAGAAPKTLDEAAVGGLGLVMVRYCADWLDYRREGNRNHLTFGAHWTS